MNTSYPLWIGKLPGVPRDKIARAPLYPHKDVKQLEQSLEAGPQFRRLNWRELLAWRADQLRIVLISRQDYYAAQAAAHLTALDLLQRRYPGGHRPNCSEREGARDLSRHLTLLDASALGQVPEGGDKPLRLARLNTPAVLIRGESFNDCSREVLDQLEDAAPTDIRTRPTHIFIAMHPDRIDPELLANLQLKYAFHVGVVDEPDLPYLAQLLRELTVELLPAREDVDWEELVRRVQEIRGEEFTECDLTCIPTLAIMNGSSVPASQEDLTPKLFDLASL